MAAGMISVAYGITYIFGSGSIRSPLEPYFILLLFAIGFVIFSVYIEKKRDDAVFPWSLLGGAVASAIFSFVVIAALGGMRYILDNGFTGLGIDMLVYAFSICIIISMVLLNLARHKL
ncbi:MAG TPA: hypothetical protein VIO11_08345 [Candidatus Methanoperedens sp.]